MLNSAFIGGCSNWWKRFKYFLNQCWVSAEPLKCCFVLTLNTFRWWLDSGWRDVIMATLGCRMRPAPAAVLYLLFCPATSFKTKLSWRRSAAEQQQYVWELPIRTHAFKAMQQHNCKILPHSCMFRTHTTPPRAFPISNESLSAIDPSTA